MSLFKRLLGELLGRIPYAEDSRCYKKIIMVPMEALFKHENDEIRFIVKNHNSGENNNEQFIVFDVLLSECEVLSENSAELIFTTKRLNISFRFKSAHPGVSKLCLEVTEKLDSQAEPIKYYGEIGNKCKAELIELLVEKGLRTAD